MKYLSFLNKLLWLTYIHQYLENDEVTKSTHLRFASKWMADIMGESWSTDDSGSRHASFSSRYSARPGRMGPMRNPWLRSGHQTWLGTTMMEISRWKFEKIRTFHCHSSLPEVIGWILQGTRRYLSVYARRMRWRNVFNLAFLQDSKDSRLCAKWARPVMQWYSSSCFP